MWVYLLTYNYMNRERGGEVAPSKKQEQAHEALIEAGLDEEEMAQLAFNYTQENTSPEAFHPRDKFGKYPDGSTNYVQALAYLEQQKLDRKKI
jgi:hypothetical protein